MGHRYERGDDRLLRSRGRAWEQPGSGVRLGAGVLVTWRIWVAGIHVETDGIKAVGFLLSRRFRWDEIDHFGVLPLGGYPYVGHVVLRDGRKVGTYGIGAPGRPKSKGRAVSPSGAAA